MIDLEKSAILAVAVSPLPNLLSKLGPGAELVHNVSFSPVRGSCFSGEAAIRLTADRSKLAVRVRSGGFQESELQLVRVTGGAGATTGRDKEPASALLLLVVRLECAFEPECDAFTKEFAASDGFASIHSHALAGIPGIFLDAVNVIEGITLRPANLDERALPPAAPGFAKRAVAAGPAKRHDQATADEGEYLRRRMLTEIKAALRARRPGVASVHIGLATLYAERIGSQAATVDFRPS